MMNIVIDRTNRMLRMELNGIWSHEDLATFKGKFAQALVELNVPAGQHTLSIDLRDATLQTQALIADAQQFIASVPNKARRIALVAASALSKMQTKRLAMRADMILFETMPDAEDWLLDRALVT